MSPPCSLEETLPTLAVAPLRPLKPASLASRTNNLYQGKPFLHRVPWAEGDHSLLRGSEWDFALWRLEHPPFIFRIEPGCAGGGFRSGAKDSSPHPGHAGSFPPSRPSTLQTLRILLGNLMSSKRCCSSAYLALIGLIAGELLLMVGGVPPKHIEMHAEADWHARGGRTYSEIQMDGKGTNPHQYVSTFNSVQFESSLAHEQEGTDKELGAREAAYAALLVKLKAMRACHEAGSSEGNSTILGSASAYTMRGRREYMEDTFAIHHPPKRPAGSGSGEGEEPALFGLFDGHGGNQATNYCRDNLLARALEFIRGRGSKTPSRNVSPVAGTPKGGSRAGTPRTGGSLRGSRSGSPNPREVPREGVSLGWLKRAMHYAFTQTDREVLLAGINDGTTGVSLAVSSSHLLVSNCGDSRAVLWDQADGGVDFALSLDHKPSRRAEKRRIEALGGRITYFGVPRVNGVLAVSRAIGDSAYKRFIISDPEQRSLKRTPSQRFVVLASDGLWDVIASREACEMVLEHWDDADHGAEALSQEAFTRGSFDNITVLIVDLSSKELASIRDSGEDEDVEIWEDESFVGPEEDADDAGGEPDGERVGADF